MQLLYFGTIIIVRTQHSKFSGTHSLHSNVNLKLKLDLNLLLLIENLLYDML